MGANFRRIIILSENFVTLNFLQLHNFFHGCQAVLIVPHNHQLLFEAFSVLIRVSSSNKSLGGSVINE